MFPRQSPALSDLLCQFDRQVRSRPSGLRALFSRQADLSPLLDEMIGLGEIALLPYLLDDVHNSDPKLRAAAERGVQTLLPRLRVEQIVELEAFMREAWTEFHAFSGNECLAGSAAALKLTTVAPSGYRREKAIAALTAMADTTAFPFILLRLNDWVPQVRGAAIRWFQACQSSLSDAQIVEAFPVLIALTERSQGRASPIVQTLMRRLETPEAAPLVLAALPPLTRRARLLAFSILAHGGALRDSGVQEKLIAHPDPLLGIFLLKALRSTGAGFPDALARLGIESKRTLLRRYTWYNLSPAQIEIFLPLLSLALFDPVRGLRDFAQYHLRKRLSSAELQAAYQFVLQTPVPPPRRLAIAIMGWHEVGGTCSEAEYFRWIRNPSVQVRVAALRCFAATSFDAALPFLKQACIDPSHRSLAKAALSLLSRHTTAFTLQEILAWLESHQPSHLRVRAFYLLCRRGKWERLPILLRLTHDDSLDLREKSKEKLRYWFYTFNRVQIQPTGEDLIAASVELASAEHSLDPDVVSQLKDILKTFASILRTSA